MRTLHTAEESLVPFLITIDCMLRSQDVKAIVMVIQNNMATWGKVNSIFKQEDNSKIKLTNFVHSHPHTHTHTHMYIYIYIYIYMLKGEIPKKQQVE